MKNLSFLIVFFLFLSIYQVKSQSISWTNVIAGNEFLNYNGYNDNGQSIIANETNVFVSGVVTGSSTIISGNFTAESNFCFLACYDLEGDLVWWKKLPGWGVTDLVFDQSGNIIVSGEDERNIFVHKYNINGELLFQKDYFTEYSWSDIKMRPNCITIDKNDNILISGSYFFGSIDTVFIADTFITEIIYNRLSAFILKCTPDGNFNSFYSSNFTDDNYNNYCRVMDVKVDSENNTYLIGYFNANPDSLIFGHTTINSNYTAEYTGEGDAFILKLDSVNNTKWVKTFGGDLDDYGNKLSIDNNDNIYFTGTYNNQLCVGDICLNSNGRLDIFLGKLDSNGNLVWLKSAGGQFKDAGRSVFVDENSDVYISGSYYCIATFGEDDNAETIYISDESSFSCYSGGFIAKYSTDGEFLWVENMQGKTSSIYDLYELNKELFLTGSFYPDISFVSQSIPYAYSGTDNVFIISLDMNSVGIDDLYSNDKSINIYPNPSKGNLNIIIGKKKEGRIYIYNLQGKLLLSKKIDSSDNIELFNFNESIFIIKVVLNNGETYTKKIIKF